jgi:hypothetical protein
MSRIAGHACAPKPTKNNQAKGVRWAKDGVRWAKDYVLGDRVKVPAAAG